MEPFYQTVAQLSFTLLGLWWVVVQTRYDTWIRDPLSRRIATHISLYFLLPGSMSLFAVLQSEVGAVWRMAFFVASVFGIAESVALLRVVQHAKRSSYPLWNLAAIILYALIAMGALVPQLVRMLGFAPLAATGMLVALLLLLGTSHAWTLFIEPERSA